MLLDTIMLGRGFTPINETCDEESYMGSYIYEGRSRVSGYECVVNYDTNEFRFTAAISPSTCLEGKWLKNILADSPFEEARTDFEAVISAIEKREKRNRL